MSKLTELRNLIQGDNSVSGRVVAVSGDRVWVATHSGVMEVSGGTNLKTGDVVTVHNGWAVKRQKGSEAPVFLV